MNEYEVQEQEVFEWHGFAKVWLWIIFIANILSGVAYIANIAMGLIEPLIGVLGLAAEAIIVTGAVLLLFKKKKLGFFVVIGAAVLALVMNALNDNLVGGIISTGLSVLILWLAIRKDMDKLA